MKNLLMGLVLTASTTAFAQTSTTTSSTTTTAPTGAAAPTQTMTTQVPSVVNNFGGNVIFEASAGVGALKDDKTEAKVDSFNSVGLTYKISDKLKTELRHNYSYAVVSDREQLRNEDTGAIDDAYKMEDPTLHLTVKTDYSLLNSKPVSISGRYYIPASDASRASNTLGTLRVTSVLNWDMTTKATFDYLAETRLGANTTSNSDGNLGADSTMRFVTGPGATYNFSDSLSAYYIAYLDLVTTGHQRGDFQRADRRNHLWQELGVSLSAGIFTINPYYSTKAVRAEDKVSYEGAGSDANSAYNLLVQAVF